MTDKDTGPVDAQPVEPLTDAGITFAESLLTSPFGEQDNVTIPRSLLRSLLDAARAGDGLLAKLRDAASTIHEISLDSGYNTLHRDPIESCTHMLCGDAALHATATESPEPPLPGESAEDVEAFARAMHARYVGCSDGGGPDAHDWQWHLASARDTINEVRNPFFALHATATEEPSHE